MSVWTRVEEALPQVGEQVICCHTLNGGLFVGQNWLTDAGAWSFPVGFVTMWIPLKDFC